MSKNNSQYSIVLRLVLVVITAVVMVLGVAHPTRAQQNQANAQPREIEVYHLRGPIYVLFNAGGNITVSVGPDGVMMVDTGLANMAEKVLAAVRQLQTQLAFYNSPPTGFGAETRSSLERLRTTAPPPKPIRFIINTHLHGDHTGGNELLATAGVTITGGNVAGNIRDSGTGAMVYAHENVLNRMNEPPAGQPPPSFRSLPTDTYHSAYYKFSHYFNGDGVQLIHQPEAHTDGDTLVWFRNSDVISTGDVFVNTSYPNIDVARGGSIQGEIKALNNILDLAFTEFRLEGGTFIVPGHGRICDAADVAYYRDMLTILRDRIQDMINKGMTLEQVKAGRPTKDYDPRYGSPDRFIEAVYTNLSKK